MDNQTSTLNKNMTEEELLQKVAEVIKTFKGADSLIQALHVAQNVFGHLSLDVQKIVADSLKIPLSEVSGVVSFYSFFSTEPRGKHTIRICLGTACYVRGGKSIVEKLSEILDIYVGQTTKDRLFSLEIARCIGACGLAPAVSIDDKVYKQVNSDKLDEILSHYYLGEGC